jgi:hypothetical protein
MWLWADLLDESKSMLDLPYVQFNVSVYMFFMLVQVLLFDLRLLVSWL